MLKQKYGPNGTGEGCVTFCWAAVGVGDGYVDGVWDGILNFSLLNRRLRLNALWGDGVAAWRRRRLDSAPELHGHVFIFDLCGFIFVHTTRECAADAEPGSGSQALDGSRGLRWSASPPTRQNWIKLFRDSARKQKLPFNTLTEDSFCA